ncbi:GMC family oxidoreductase N-terminal domain-containing protein [Paraconexibacter sp.]|uniref:GMC family oxidoreductase N-terminal domain-containing protein n=1 Tax=Paraconexibacter sp. TaxID=2949640 RepID=UPI003567646B
MSTPVRDTGPAAYRDGTGTFHPDHRRIVDGRHVDDERRITVDACVIGTGAGGAPVAKELAEGGMSVAMLEEGIWHETSEFTARPRDMMPRLYRDAGQTVTAGNPPIVLPLGRAVGGTTLINMATCFRTPERVLRRWQREFGLDGLGAPDLEPYFRRVEREINVVQVPPDIAGENARIVERGTRALGYRGDYLFRAVRGCVGSGVCAFGCPSGAKQHTAITWVPRAWAAGATTYTAATATRIIVQHGKVREVIARTAGGGTLRIRCRHAIVSAGALLTPVLLQRLGLGTRSGQLGRNLSIHPASAARALFDEPVDAWKGVPQSFYVDELADDGIILEGIAGPPDQAAMSTPGSGEAHRDLMLRIRETASFGVMVSDTGRGRVHTVLGRPHIRYDLHRDDAERFRRGFELLAEIFFAAGAREVHVPLAGVGPMRDGDLGPLQERAGRIRPRHVSAMAFHPLGTARMGADPATSVVDGDLAVHGVDGLHVCDGSVVPSSLGVNPQMTIMTLAVRLAYHLLGAPAPTHEPAPARIA